MENPISSEFEENNDMNSNTENQSSIDSPKNIDNNEDKKPFFLMTLEDNLGKCQQIKIYQNSNPSELAFNFCKENNLDFSSMKYIKSNIKTIIKKFNDPQQKALIYNNSNNSIKEEEDEDDYLTEGTMRSNERQINKEDDEVNKTNELKKKSNFVDNSNNKDNINNIDKDVIDENAEYEIASENNDNNNYINKEKDEVNNNNNDSIEQDINGKKNKENIVKEKDDIKEENENNDINNNRNSKSIKSTEKENKNAEVIKSLNTFSKMPLKINQISPKQIEINENIQKIINNTFKSNNSNSLNINSEHESTNNVKSLKAEIYNLTNKQNFNVNINGTDRCSNSVQIPFIDKEVKEISNSLKAKRKTKLSDLKQNNFIDSPYKFSEKSENKKEKYKKFNNDNNDFNNNFDLNNFGEKYINLNKKTNFNRKVTKKENTRNLNHSGDSIESGVPVLNNENEHNYYNNNSEPINYNLSIHKNEVIKKNDKKEKDKDKVKNNNSNNNINKYGNKINKVILLNKMKKLEFNLPKKNDIKNRQIDKLYNLIKNSCYNMNKNANNKHNKIRKEKKAVTNILDINKLKIKESNSIDINYEISRTYETDPNNIYTKEFYNNINGNIENSYKKNNYITNFNNYIENNKINHIKNNVSISNNETHQINLTNSINRHYFFSNPNLSSNQEPINKSNTIYSQKHNFKNLKKSKISTKSKSLGKDKNKKIKSISKNKNRLSRKHNDNVNSKVKAKDIMKEKAKRCSLKFKNKYHINNNSATPNINEEKKTRYLNLKSCQTPPTKKVTNSSNYINSIFSEWVMSTIGKGSRNVFSTRDTYFPKRDNNQTSKSVSELADATVKKSNYRMLLSKSNFKNVKPNIIVKKIKCSMRSKASKENNNVNNNINHHHYLNSLKMNNNSDTLWHRNTRNNSNNINFNCMNSNNNNESHVIHKKSTDRNNIMNKKQMDKLIYNNANNNTNTYNNNPNINTINDYNFNNNNYYLSRLINNTIQNFIYDSNENSKSGDKFRKIIQKQLTSPPKVVNYSREFFGSKSRKKSSDKIVEYKTTMNKIGKILLNNSGSNQSCTTDNILNNNNQNININNLININNYQKNKNYNFNYDYNNNTNGNNHYIKNSKLKKKKVGNNNKMNINSKNAHYNNLDANRKLIDFSNELTNYYLSTEICKNNYNSNLTYSNLINNNRTLSNIDFSTEEKMIDEILINIFNKIYIFFNKEKANKIILLDSICKKKINLFPKNISKILNNMIQILCINFSKKKKNNNIAYNSIINSTKNSSENIIAIDKNNFINEMLYVYKYYLSNENKKTLLSCKDNIDKIIQESVLDRSFYRLPKNITIKNDYISPKSFQKKSQYKNKTESKNNGKPKSD